jgi:hypothetical protein
MPAPPQVQAREPENGRSGWRSQTHRLLSHRAHHFMRVSSRSGNGKPIPSLGPNGSHLPHGHMQQHRFADDGLWVGLTAGGWGSPRWQCSAATADHPTTRKRPAAPTTVGLQRLATSSSSSTETGTSSNSTKRRRSSSAISTVTSRDQPSAVLKATIRLGRLY